MDEIEIVIPKDGEWKLRELDNLSIDALNEYVEELQLELTRVKSEIDNRHVVRSDADAIFKK